MKHYIKNIAFLACASAAACGLQSCVSEDIFDNCSDGALRVRMVINSDLTRAETDNADLGESTVLYISSAKGLVRKYKGMETIPDRIPLKAGSYIAEAWAGDSVSASFDKKFYQGQTEFQINGGDTDVTLSCGIANVVASVNKATVDAVSATDLKVTVGHSRGSLDFTADNFDDKGYFMMPNADKNLSYTVAGVNSNGDQFSISGEIPDVKKGHEYILNLSDTPTYDEIGGAFLTIVIDDKEILKESEVVILGRPDVKGEGFDIEKQLFANSGQFEDVAVRVKAFGTVEKLIISSPDAEALGLPSAEVDLLSATDDVKASMRSKGIEWEKTKIEGKNLELARIYFKASYLNSLKDGAYELTVSAHDSYGKYTDAKVRIGVGEGNQIIDDPVVLDAIGNNDYLNIRARRAVLTGSIIDATRTPSLQYREEGASEWTTVSLESVAAIRRKNPKRVASQGFKVTIKDLKPATTYEARVVADSFESESRWFTTEGVFSIPNAGFEDWDTYSAKTLLGTKTVIFPGSGTRSFWDSGNEGGATANKILTNKSTDMVHSGTYSARLGSLSAFSLLAAGNVFVGSYVETDGTNGVLKFGREYNCSHPDKVAVWANYRPGKVDIIKDGNQQYIDFQKGDSDHGQIYVALTTEQVDIRTNPDKRKLFNPDSSEVIAYGQVTWKEAFGPDGSLQKVEIPFTYNDRAVSNKPLYLVIVCCASKFGDYFSGSSSSVMYLDDFELIYE